MYAIGMSESDFIQIESELFVTDKVTWSEIKKVVYHTNNCTMFSDFEEAEDALDIIKSRRYEIKFEDGSDDSIGSIIFYLGKTFDIDALKIYELVVVEVNNKE